MKIMIEATTSITRIGGVECRVWKGTTEDGVDCVLFVHRIAVDKAEDHSEFQRELQEKMPPAVSVPLRHVI